MSVGPLSPVYTFVEVYLRQVNYSLLVKVKCLGDLLVECEEVVSLEEKMADF